MKQRIKNSYNRLRRTNIISNFFNLSSIQISNVLLLLLTIRLVTGNIGLERFGMMMYAYRFSMLASTVINYGTSQSAVRDTALNVTDTQKLGSVFYSTLCIRSIIFLLFLILLTGAYWLRSDSYVYLMLALPIVLAEVFNPLCFYIGVEKIKMFNIFNLLSNAMAVIAIYFFIKRPADAPWVNFILGMGNAITYLSLLTYLAIKLKLKFSLPSKTCLLAVARENFYLTANNISANLQQSIIIFALKFYDSGLLGAYGLCDRFIGQCRNLLNTITNAIYPNAVNVYKKSIEQWDTYRRKTKYLFAGLAFAGAAIIITLADLIIFILSKEHNADAVTILRIMALVPILSAMNVFSMLDLLLKKANLVIFKVAIILVVIAVMAAFAVSSTANIYLIGAFTIIIEASALLLYEYAIKNKSRYA